MYHTSFAKTLLVLSVAALLLPHATRAVDCTERPNHPQCGPGSEGQPITPARITFTDAVDHEIRSDGGIYEHSGVIGGLEVFIGSSANDGNIFLRLNDSGRMLDITMPTNSCGLTSGPFDAGLKVSVDAEVSGGVFGLDPGEMTMVPMRVSIRDLADNLCFLDFDPRVPGPCKGKSGLVKVERSADGLSWTVSDDGSACISKHTGKGQGDLCAGAVEMNFSFRLEEL